MDDSQLAPINYLALTEKFYEGGTTENANISHRWDIGTFSCMKQRGKVSILNSNVKFHYLYTNEKAGQCEILEFKTVSHCLSFLADNI